MAEIPFSNVERQRGSPTIARKRIETFAGRFGQAHLHFAQHAAFPLALTPDLAYRLWANFQRDIPGERLGVPWVAVADLLLSNLCREVSHELYEMDRAVREELLRALQADPLFGPQRLRELSHFLLKQTELHLESHDPDLQDLARAQRWTALAYVHPDDAARDLALALRTSFEQQNIPEQLRLASLLETFTQPLSSSGFAPLITYARGIERLARGDLDGAQAQMKEVATTETVAEFQGLSLPIPAFARMSDSTAEQLQKDGSSVPSKKEADTQPVPPLSDIQQQIYRFIVKYMQDKGISPTNREIGRVMNIASTGHVDYHLSMLEKQGLIERIPKKARSIRLLQPLLKSIPVLGSIGDDNIPVLVETGVEQRFQAEQESLADAVSETKVAETSVAKLAALNEKVLITQEFAAAFRQLSVQKRELVARKIELLLNNPLHPSLNAHRLRVGFARSQIWECYIDRQLRLIYEIRQDILHLWYLGNHEIIDRANRSPFADSVSFFPFKALQSDQPRRKLPLRVFCAYAHRDEQWLRQMEVHFYPLVQEGLIEWRGTDILSKTDTALAFTRNLNNAALILFLISVDFIASDFCYGVEIQQATKLHQLGKARVVPILLRPTLWKETPFGELQALPKGGRPVSTWDNPEVALVEIANNIRQLVKEIAEPFVPPVPAEETRIWSIPIRAIRSSREVSKNYRPLKMR